MSRLPDSEPGPDRHPDAAPAPVASPDAGPAPATRALSSRPRQSIQPPSAMRMPPPTSLPTRGAINPASIRPLPSDRKTTTVDTTFIARSDPMGTLMPRKPSATPAANPSMLTAIANKRTPSTCQSPLPPVAIAAFPWSRLLPYGGRRRRVRVRRGSSPDARPGDSHRPSPALSARSEHGFVSPDGTCGCAVTPLEPPLAVRCCAAAVTGPPACRLRTSNEAGPGGIPRACSKSACASR